MEGFLFLWLIFFERQVTMIITGRALKIFNQIVGLLIFLVLKHDTPAFHFNRIVAKLRHIVSFEGDDFDTKENATVPCHTSKTDLVVCRAERTSLQVVKINAQWFVTQAFC
jgi:hypothetical protein